MIADDIVFIQPTIEHRQAVMAYKDAYLSRHDDVIHGSGGLERFDDDYQAWLDYINAPAGTNLFGYDKVPASHFLAMHDNQVIGVVGIRHELTEFLHKIGGHVGYSTHPDFEGRGVATIMLGFAVQFLAKIGVNRVLVTCDDENIGSARVIEKNGGQLENIISMGDKQVRRYWIG